MPSDNVFVGLDIGTTKICAVIAEYNDDDKLAVSGIGIAPSTGLKQGVVINIEAAMKAVIEAVEAAEMMSGREVVSVTAGIAGGHIKGINQDGFVPVMRKSSGLKKIEPSEISREDMERAIESAKAFTIPMDREILHVIPQGYIVDDQDGIVDPLGMIGIRLGVKTHIITGSITSGQNLIKCINRAGFKVDDIVLQSLASSKAVLRQDEANLGVLMIDIGGGTTDVIVHSDGAPYHTDVIPYGGNSVTSDLSIVLKIPFEAAEKLKIESGCCYMGVYEDDDEEVEIPSVGGWASYSMPKRKIMEIIQPRVEEIFNMIKESLDKKDYMKLLNNGIVLTGGGALMPGIAQLASEIFNLPVRVGYPSGCLGITSAFKNPMYSTAVGLVIFESEEMEKNDKNIKLSDNDNFFTRLKNWFKEFF